MKVKELFKIRKGKKANQEVETYQDDAVRYIQIEDLRNDDNIKYCIKDDDVILANENDIIIAWDGANAATSNYSLKGAIGSTLGRLRPKRDDFYIPYVGLFLKSKQKYLRDNCTGATIPHVDRKVLQNLDIPLPDYEIQKKIADVIEKANALGQKRRNTIEKLDELTQSVFLDMFGDPSINPKGWPIKTIGEVCHTVKDGPHKSLDYVEDGVPFLSVNNIINDEWDIDEVRHISEEDYNKYKKRCEPERGDVLYTKGGTTGFAKYIDIDLKFLNWVHLALLKFDNKEIDGRFLAAMLNSDFCYQQSQKNTRGVANQDLVLSQIKKIEILKPPLEIQKSFGQKVKSIKRAKIKYNDSESKLENLFNSLLQKAFEGELNFSDNDEQLLTAEKNEEYVA